MAWGGGGVVLSRLTQSAGVNPSWNWIESRGHFVESLLSSNCNVSFSFENLSNQRLTVILQSSRAAIHLFE